MVATCLPGDLSLHTSEISWWWQAGDLGTLILHYHLMVATCLPGDPESPLLLDGNPPTWRPWVLTFTWWTSLPRGLDSPLSLDSGNLSTRRPESPHITNFLMMAPRDLETLILYCHLMVASHLPEDPDSRLSLDDGNLPTWRPESPHIRNVLMMATWRPWFSTATWWWQPGSLPGDLSLHTAEIKEIKGWKIEKKDK